MKKIILEIKELNAQMRSTKILKGLNLTVQSGEIHAIMGPNGSGKSTLAKVLTRHKDYKITKGFITYKNENLLTYNTEKCAQNGIFLSFQHPVTLPGVDNTYFLREIFNSMCVVKKKKILSTLEFKKLLDKHVQELDMSEKLLLRNVNEGFSGGEKKYNEILQMSLLNPDLIILDEIDSGLDADAIKKITNTLLKLKKNNKAILLITHYTRLLEYVKPDFVHLLLNGKIVRSGTIKLAQDIEKKGYTEAASGVKC